MDIHIGSSLSEFYFQYVKLLHTIQGQPNGLLPPQAPYEETVFQTLNRYDSAIQTLIDKKVDELNTQEHEDISNWLVNVDRILVAMGEEVSEVRRILPWKFWKHYRDFQLKPEDKENLKKEVIDLLCFTLTLAFMVGTKIDELPSLLMDKFEINTKRWEGGEY